MRAAYALAREALPNHTSRFSRKDFTLRQLFACLVLRPGGLFGAAPAREAAAFRARV